MSVIIIIIILIIIKTGRYTATMRERVIYIHPISPKTQPHNINLYSQKEEKGKMSRSLLKFNLINKKSDQSQSSVWTAVIDRSYD